MLENAHEIKKEKRRASLEENKEIIKISKQLVTLKDDVELPLSINELSYKPMDVKKLISFLEDMEFNKIKSSVVSKFGLKENDSKNNNEELEKKTFLTLDRDPIDKKKYLVPNDITVGQFVYVIRKRLVVPPEKAIFLFINGILPPTASLLGSIYDEYKDPDHFLYITYSGENTFG